MSQPVGPSLPLNNSSCIFYKLIVASILQDKKLVKSSLSLSLIPNKFFKKFGDELSSVATLTVPGGRQWLVELREDNKRIWLDNGWNSFVEYYSICIGYFVVFKYEGNSHFGVHVYNLKSSEINYLSNNSREPGDFAEITGSSSYFLVDKDVDESLDHEKKKYKISTCLHQENELRDLRATFQSTQDKGIQFNGVELTSIGDEVMDEHEPFPRFKVKEELPAPNSPSVLRRRRDVTTEEKQGAFHAASMFKPDNPFCRIILRPSYVYKGVLLVSYHLPRSFARRYLNGVEGVITLQIPEGKKWPVQCVYCNDNLKFSKGWAEFVLDNNLDEGDVCIFELINTKEIVLKVTIFRALRD
ncbi:B3 domain-containing transcription factor VRN1-like [Gossypium australe]|uniref:B3 domain-containing transcription factor VRN1-like n=1 Tax=Gossypium australe TaxID=47621 RepID=A0A5B6V2V9_9ROSI|nr:B3 domain-containing transcription factor VRN1-like [Gossypium australe]